MRLSETVPLPPMLRLLRATVQCDTHYVPALAYHPHPAAQLKNAQCQHFTMPVEIHFLAHFHMWFK